MPILLANKTKSAHNTGLGIDFRTKNLNFEEGIKLEELAGKYKSAGKFTYFEWEKVSKQYPENRAARKNNNTKFSGEHLHISINAAAIGQI